MQSQQKDGYLAVQMQDPANATQPGEYPMQNTHPAFPPVVMQPQTAVIMVSSFFSMFLFFQIHYRNS